MLLFLLLAIGHAAERDAAPRVELGIVGHWLTHPGLSARYERRLGERGLHGFVAGRTAFYAHPRHHVGLLATGELGGRLASEVGPLVELGLGLGAHHGWLAGPVYTEVDGELRRRVDGGRPTVLGTGAMGAGWTFAGDRGWRLVLRSELWVRGPVNHRALPSPVLSLGLGARL